jgi:ubiquitin carboxyl-terminal hydrolase L5
MLIREEGKRNEWMFENALRRHNFVGFAGEVLKGVIEGKLKEGPEAYKKWIGDAKAKTKKRAEEQKKKKGGAGDEDEEMIG